MEIWGNFSTFHAILDDGERRVARGAHLSPKSQNSGAERKKTASLFPRPRPQREMSSKGQDGEIPFENVP